MSKRIDTTDGVKALVDGGFSLFKLGFIVWAIGAILGLGLLGTAIYVAAHFLAKVW